MKPVFVFDGKPPEMKSKELAKRKEGRDAADADLATAKEVCVCATALTLSPLPSRGRPSRRATVSDAFLRGGTSIAKVGPQRGLYPALVGTVPEPF